MGLVNYKDIDFNKSINKENKIINFNGSEIQIVNYLSSQDKYDLIMITLQKAFNDNIYNNYLIDLYFDLNIIYLYTNIMFNAEDRADEAGLYDILKRSGLIDAVKAEIDTKELDILKRYIYTIANSMIKYRSTFNSKIEELMEKLPISFEKIKKAIDTLDMQKINEFTDLIKEKIVATTAVTE